MQTTSRGLWAGAVLIAALGLSGCASGPTPGAPSANPIQRAKILSSNDLGITISHSRLGAQTAFKWADAHCGGLGKTAVYGGGSPSLAETISTWRCQ